MEKITHHKHEEEEAFIADVRAFGFWVYLMTDLIMFSVLFAVYFVLRNNTFGGPSTGQLFELSSAFTNTIVLLVSSFTCGLALLAAQEGKRGQVIGWLSTTFVFGGIFLCNELGEFAHFAATGADWTRSAFLSSFFTLVGTHGLHIAVGLLWIVVAMAQITTKGLTPRTVSRISRFALFWHFLDLVWIFIFATVYLQGVV